MFDALGGTTSFAYDSRGALLELVDARGAVTNFVYDSRGGLARRKTPRIETYQYDQAENTQVVE